MTDDTRNQNMNDENATLDDTTETYDEFDSTDIDSGTKGGESTRGQASRQENAEDFGDIGLDSDLKDSPETI